MGNSNRSRRDFLKLTLTSLAAAFLPACGRALGIPATPSPASLQHQPTCGKNSNDVSF